MTSVELRPKSLEVVCSPAVLSHGKTAQLVAERNRSAKAVSSGADAEEGRNGRTLAKSFASPPLEAILSKAQSGMKCVCVYPSTPGVDQQDSSLDSPGTRRSVTCATITSNTDADTVAVWNPSIWHPQESRRRSAKLSKSCRRGRSIDANRIVPAPALLTVRYY